MDNHTPLTNAQRQAKFRAATTECERRECADIARRERLEADDLAWLRYYLAEAFPKPFGDIHAAIANGFREAVTTGNLSAIAAPRGSGKTTVVNGLALKSALSGAVRFVAVIPWKEKDAGRAMRFWQTALCHNQRLADDYPDVCLPFQSSRGSSQRLAAIHWEGDNEPTGAKMVLSDGLIVFPGSRAVLGSASLNGNPRGMQYTMPDGTVLRPGLLLIDDPSDKKTARSREQTEQNIERIQEDVLGMAGPGQKIAAVLTGTTITGHDTMSHYLSDRAPDWSKVSVPQITAWPTDMDAWEEWNRLRIESRGSTMQAAREYYTAHQSAMRAGFAVSWADRYDADHGEPDAYWSAMSDYYRMGRKAFLQERQNEPEETASGLYVITPEHVESRTAHHARGTRPENAVIVTAGIDVGTATNLHWCVIASTPQMAVYVVDYGVYPDRGQPLWTEKSTETSQSAVRRGLEYLIRTLRTRYSEVSAIGVDANYLTQAVYDVCQTARDTHNVHVVPCRGVASTKFRLPQESNRHKLKALGEQCHGYRGDRGEEVWLNAHHWQRAMQEGFLADMGTPGSVQLFDGGRHTELARAVCADRLVSVVIRPDGREEHKWTLDDTAENHVADALKLAMVQANLEGASQNGSTPKPRKARKAKTKTTGSVYAIRRRENR